MELIMAIRIASTRLSGMDYFFEFTVRLGVTRINLHGLGEDAKMRSK
jgi:hypothetical protein